MAFLTGFYRFDVCSQFGNMLTSMREDNQEGPPERLLATSPGCYRAAQVLVQRGQGGRLAKPS